MVLFAFLQVLSNSVGQVMKSFGAEDCQETAAFILLMDKFFDCLNVRYCIIAFDKAVLFSVLSVCPSVREH